MSRPGATSPMTDAVNRAHSNLLRAYKIFDDKHADIPLMRQRSDPRTGKRTTYDDMLFYGSQNEPMDGPKNYQAPDKVQAKDKKPIKKENQQQTRRNMQAGIPVDPTRQHPLDMATVPDTAIGPGPEFSVM